MGNAVPQRTGAFSDEMGGQEPLSKERQWILLRWALVGVVIVATLIGNQLIHLKIPTVTVLLLCAIVVLLNIFLHYFFFVIKKKHPRSDPKLI